jgi:O-antigen/teichoic acid export membrane protein
VTPPSRLNIFSLSSGAMRVRVGRVLAVVIAAAGLQLVTQTLLARWLPKDDVGVVSLLLGALPLLSALSLAGQDSSIVRFFTRADSTHLDARGHVRRVLALVVPVGACLAFAASRYYQLAGLAAVAIVVLVASQNSVVVVTSVLRARHRYELAMAGTRLPVMASAVVLLVLAWLGTLSLSTALWAIIWVYAASALLVWFGAARGIPEGGDRVPLAVFRAGFLFFGLSVSASVMTAMDRLIIAKFLPYSELAVYATIFSIMKAFDFLFYSASYVLMPRVNTMRRIPLAGLNLSIAGAAVLVSACYLLFGKWIVHALFGGGYDGGVYLIVPFTLSGIIKLFYTVPSSVIGGRLPERALKQFLWFNIFGMALNVVLDIVLIMSMGLMGAAVATALAWGVRLLGGYLIMWRNRAAAAHDAETGDPV